MSEILKQNSQTSQEIESDTSKHIFLYASELPHDSDPDSPSFEINHSEVDELPVLSREQLTRMLAPDALTSESDLPKGDGIAAFNVDGEIIYVNISPDDYGTQLRDGKVVMHEKTSESGHEREVVADQINRALGETALSDALAEVAEQGTGSVSFESAIGKIDGLLENDNDSILSKHLRSLGGGDARNIVAHLLNSNEAKESLRTILATRLESIAESEGMPERIRLNSEKLLPGRYNYKVPKMSSRGYAVELALAKLDGTFDIERAERESRGEYPGQHRAAAELLLKSFQDEAVEARAGGYTQELDGEKAANEELMQFTDRLDSSKEELTRSFYAISEAAGHLAGLFHQGGYNSEYVAGAAYELRTRLQQVVEDVSELAVMSSRLEAMASDEQQLIDHYQEIGRVIRNVANHLMKGTIIGSRLGRLMNRDEEASYAISVNPHVAVEEIHADINAIARYIQDW